jgi:sugar phosphate isomerase/epimerase
MQLSLSVRVGENFRHKRVVEIALADLARLAQEAGFQALCMRASVVGVHSPPERVQEVRALLHDRGLAVSMVTGDFAVPENSAEGPGCLRHITPYLDLAEALGSDLLRVCIKEEADIPFAQRAADEARERHIRLAHQSHTRSLFETVAGSLDVLRKIQRPNFGLIYEPANLALCGEDYGPATLRAFQPYLFNVYLQNHVPDPAGDMPMETWVRGKVLSTLRPLDAPQGIDFASVFAGLKAIGYNGYITSHQALSGVQPQEAATRYAAFLRMLIEA